MGWYHCIRTTDVSKAPHRKGPPELEPSAAGVAMGSGGVGQAQVLSPHTPAPAPPASHGSRPPGPNRRECQPTHSPLPPATPASSRILAHPHSTPGSLWCPVSWWRPCSSCKTDGYEGWWDSPGSWAGGRETLGAPQEPPGSWYLASSLWGLMWEMGLPVLASFRSSRPRML